MGYFRFFFFLKRKTKYIQFGFGADRTPIQNRLTTSQITKKKKKYHHILCSTSYIPYYPLSSSVAIWRAAYVPAGFTRATQ